MAILTQRSKELEMGRIAVSAMVSTDATQGDGVGFVGAEATAGLDVKTTAFAGFEVDWTCFGVNSVDSFSERRS